MAFFKSELLSPEETNQEQTVMIEKKHGILLAGIFLCQILLVSLERADSLEFFLRVYAHQAKAKKVKEQLIKDQRISDKHQRKCSPSLSLSLNGP